MPTPKIPTLINPGLVPCDKAPGLTLRDLVALELFKAAMERALGSTINEGLLADARNKADAAFKYADQFLNARNV